MLAACERAGGDPLALVDFDVLRRGGLESLFRELAMELQPGARP